MRGLTYIDWDSILLYNVVLPNGFIDIFWMSQIKGSFWIWGYTFTLPLISNIDFTNILISQNFQYWPFSAPSLPQICFGVCLNNHNLKSNDLTKSINKYQKDDLLDYQLKMMHRLLNSKEVWFLCPPFLSLFPKEQKKLGNMHNRAVLSL